MTSDPVRQKIRDLLWRKGVTMREASTAIGRGPSYMHQFLERRTPAVLNYADSGSLAELLGCEAGELRHDEAPKRRRQKRRRRHAPAAVPGEPVAPVAELAVDIAAGPGAVAEDYTEEAARWYIPENMIRHEAGADPAGLRILRVRGNSMEPEMRDGDRIVVDIARRIPATGEMFVLWDGGGLVVKRVEIVPLGEPPQLRLHSANPEYEAYTCLADEAHVIGRVVWTVSRV